MKKTVSYILTMAAFFLVFGVVVCMNVNADYVADHEQKKGKSKINIVDKNGEFVTSSETFEDVPLDDKTQAEIIDACYEYGIDPRLLFAVGYVETGWQNIRSYSGQSHGIWQIMPNACKDYIWQGCDLYDPVDNALVAVQALAAWKKEFPDTREMLMAYNKGYDRSNWVEGYADAVLSEYYKIN